MDKQLSDKIKIISFFSIVLVVFLHSFNIGDALNPNEILFKKSFIWCIEDIISFGLTRIAVPIFFILSGFLFFLNSNGSINDFLKKIKKRVRSLFIPFLLWSLFGIGFYFILQSIPCLTPFFTKELIIDYTFQKWFLTIFVNPIPYQLWFIRDLMVLVLISPLLYYLLKHFWQGTLLLVFILWIFISNEFQNSIEASFFFLAGGYLSIHNPKFIEISYRKKVKYFVLVWLFLVLIKTSMGYLDIQSFAIRGFLKISILIGIISFWGIYDLLFTIDSGIKEKLLQVSGFTFFIYLSHEPLLTVIKKVFFIVLGKEEINYLQVYIVAPVSTILCCILIAVVLKNNLKTLYEIITGGR